MENIFLFLKVKDMISESSLLEVVLTNREELVEDVRIMGV